MSTDPRLLDLVTQLGRLARAYGGDGTSHVAMEVAQAFQSGFAEQPEGGATIHLPLDPDCLTQPAGRLGSNLSPLDIAAPHGVTLYVSSLGLHIEQSPNPYGVKRGVLPPDNPYVVLQINPADQATPPTLVVETRAHRGELIARTSVNGQPEEE